MHQRVRDFRTGLFHVLVNKQSAGHRTASKMQYPAKQFAAVEDGNRATMVTVDQTSIRG